ncbi:ABC transporter substrate-binding protein [Candidatus Albibeggiatoa sp. nov. NOAA]|uniref:ABC transporter substrate-binding protein n=1 Tax=Candidatus Albibeggiatoa sp. nov. NOAA TaxID=3162724 RepID=UPI0032FA2D5B|nr:ABC transporter substrate-binding protein [Thiotrichaceae bacterium]
MSKRYYVISILSIIILLALITIFYPTPTSFKKTDGHTHTVPSITIGAAIDLINSLVWIADNQQYFKQAGVNVELKPYPSGKVALNAFLNGEVDLATTAEAPFVFKSFEHEDLFLFSTLGSADNEAKIIARTDRGITKPEDLKGKNVATQKASAVHFFLSSFLTHHYITSDELNISYMKGKALPQALIDGEIDAFSMREPFLQQAKEGLPNKTIIFEAPGIYTKTFNLIGSQQFVNVDNHIVEAILQALIKAEMFVKQHPEQAIAIIAKLRELPVNRVSNDWDNFNFSISLNQALLTSLEEEARWAIQSNFITATQSPNYLQRISFTALKKIRPTSISIIH